MTEQFTVTRSQVSVRHRCENAIVIFLVDGIDKDKRPRAIDKLEKERAMYDFYWQPIFGATYHFAGYRWEVCEIDVELGKHKSKKTKHIPVVTLKIKEQK